MISVIIPTLLKVDRLERTLKELSSLDQIGEILLINNTGEKSGYDEIPKVREIIQTTNIYVNPAWNLGYNESKFDKLCILNDDIWFDWSRMETITDFIRPEIGMIGMSSDNYLIPTNEFEIVEYNGRRPMGYACCFFIHKLNWDAIPEQLKLWAGDDWIFYRNKNKNYIINGLQCDGYLSATIDDVSLAEEFTLIKNNDMVEMVKLIKNNQIGNYLIGTKWWK